jgi:tRNA G37 N-methylase Trm5
VKYGFYKDTYFHGITHWSLQDFSSQLLGCYELQIQEKIFNIQNKYKLQNIINIGAGTGYHIISLIKKNCFKNGYAFETNIKAQEILRKNAIANNVEKNIKILGEGNFISIKNNISQKEIIKSLFLIDIEGHEFSFFTKENMHYFNKSHFIIEEHLFDYNTRLTKNSKQFYKLIYDNFIIKKIKNSYRNPFEYKIIDKFSDDEKFLMMSEGRSETMQWLYLKPKF